MADVLVTRPCWRLRVAGERRHTDRHQRRRHVSINRLSSVSIPCKALLRLHCGAIKRLGGRRRNSAPVVLQCGRSSSLAGTAWYSGLRTALRFATHSRAAYVRCCVIEGVQCVAMRSVNGSPLALRHSKITRWRCRSSTESLPEYLLENHIRQNGSSVTCFTALKQISSNRQNHFDKSASSRKQTERIRRRNLR